MKIARVLKHSANPTQPYYVGPNPTPVGPNKIQYFYISVIVQKNYDIDAG